MQRRDFLNLAGAVPALNVLAAQTPKAAPAPAAKASAAAEYFEYAYVDVPAHQFHPLHAVPWLAKVFRI